MTRTEYRGLSATAAKNAASGRDDRILVAATRQNSSPHLQSSSSRPKHHAFVFVMRSGETPVLAFAFAFAFAVAVVRSPPPHPTPSSRPQWRDPCIGFCRCCCSFSFSHPNPVISTAVERPLYWLLPLLLLVLRRPHSNSIILSFAAQKGIPTAAIMACHARTRISDSPLQSPQSEPS